MSGTAEGSISGSSSWQRVKCKHIAPCFRCATSDDYYYYYYCCCYYYYYYYYYLYQYCLLFLLLLLHRECRTTEGNLLGHWGLGGGRRVQDHEASFSLGLNAKLVGQLGQHDLDYQLHPGPKWGKRGKHDHDSKVTSKRQNVLLLLITVVVVVVVAGVVVVVVVVVHHYHPFGKNHFFEGRSKQLLRQISLQLPPDSICD